YGADGVRVGIMLSSSAGNDLLFDEELMVQGRNFATKIWNAYRLIQGWEIIEKPANSTDILTMEWFANQLDKTMVEIQSQFEKFRISDALHLVYKLIWDDFCAWYLEAIKPNYGEGISKEVHKKTISFFEELMKLLHPFMPFLTEELWQNIANRNIEDALMISQQKAIDNFDELVLENFDFAKEIISGIRNYRQSKGISPREEIEIFTNVSHLENCSLIEKLGNVSQISFNQKTDKPSYSFLVGAVEIAIPLSEKLDLEEEKKKTTEEISYLQGFLISVDKKLSNEKFVANAKPEIVDNERKKQKDAQEKILLLQEKLKSL
ncbi:MAG: class I tRNA ligase family protein, partial [Bacteroidetes bacterium]|nr:class I tRNA ligase family protein [Bacteroidota bacterium]